MSNSRLLVAAAVAALGGTADAFWRLPCQSRSGLGRIDPIVDFGKISSHVHAIHGGNNFGFSTNADDLLNSDCTSCQVTQDKSAYWTPPLYFIDAATGKAEMVWEEGGMLAYYLLYSNPGEQIQAFPKGFQMISGDTTRRNFTCAVPEPPKSEWTGYEVTQPALAQKALGFNCLNYFDPSKTEPSLYRHHLPDKSFMDENCLSGVRFELMFPSCWNGKDLDSPDHRSHVAFPDLVMTGTCPEGFPHRLPSLFFETIWRTDLFKGRDGQFVIANGDPTGYGYHGDFMAAWEDGVLQNAVDQCTNPSGMVQDCPVFNLQTLEDQEKCSFSNPPAIAAENNTDPFAGLAQTGLLGPNPIQWGPAPAVHGGSGLGNLTAGMLPTQSNTVSAVLATDSNGGGIAVATPVASGAHLAAHPSVTAAPALEPTASADKACFSTTTIIKDQELWEVCINKELVTVTATEIGPVETPAASAHRRHLHEHQRRAGHI